MSSLSSEHGVTTLSFSPGSNTHVEVVSYDGLGHVKVQVDTGSAFTSVRFNTGNPGVAAKLAQQFAEAARSQGYTGPLTF